MYLFFFFFFNLFRAAPVAYGSSQARCGIEAVAAGLCHSYSNNQIRAVSVTYTTTHSSSRSLTCCAGLGIKPVSQGSQDATGRIAPEWELLLFSLIISAPRVPPRSGPPFFSSVLYRHPMENPRAQSSSWAICLLSSLLAFFISTWPLATGALPFLTLAASFYSQHSLNPVEWRRKEEENGSSYKFALRVLYYKGHEAFGTAQFNSSLIIFSMIVILIEYLHPDCNPILVRL